MSLTVKHKIKFKNIAFVIIFAMAGCLVADRFFKSSFRHPDRDLFIEYSTDSSHYKFKGVLVDDTTTIKHQRDTLENVKILFHHNPDMVVLTMLVLIVIAMASGSFPAFIWQAGQLKKIFRLEPRQIVFSVLFAFLFLGFLYFIQFDFPGWSRPEEIMVKFEILFKKGHEKILDYMVVAALLLQIPLLTVIFLIGPSSDNISSINISKKETMLKAAFQLRYLNRVLRNAFWVLSIGIVFSVLTSSALAASIKASIDIAGFDIHPQKMCLVLGLFYSLYIGIIYIPIYLYLKNRNDEFKETLIGNQHLLTDEDENIAQRIVSAMDAKSSFFENLQVVSTVLAPVISGLLPGLI